MLRLFIVDDEKRTRDGVRNLTDWSRFGIGQVHTAGGGAEALAECGVLAPDILISDVRMPGMDGIALCESLRAAFPDLQIIFLSGYAEKDYLKAAIHLDAVSFVEKPVKPAELEQAVARAAERCKRLKYLAGIRASDERDLPAMRRLALLNLIAGVGGAAAQAQETSRARLFERGGDCFRALVLRLAAPCGGQAQFEEWLSETCAGVFGAVPHVFAAQDARQAVAVLYAEHPDALCDCALYWDALRTALRRSSCPAFCAVGAVHRGPDGVARSYRDASLAAQNLFFEGYGGLSFYRDAPRRDAEPERGTVAAFADCVARRDRAEALALLEQFRTRLCIHKNLSAPAVRDTYLQLCGQLFPLQNRRLDPQEPADASPFYLWERFRGFDTLNQLHEFVAEAAGELLAAPEGSPAVCKAIEQIESRFAEEDLSVKSLAEAAFVTPSYLSRLFKKETGKTIVEYLTGVRMEKAKELFRDKRLKLYHVSLLVGYTDPSYFAKCFKREVGVSPSDYRERALT
jgi:two-component system response regulator YesN